MSSRTRVIKDARRASNKVSKLSEPTLPISAMLVVANSEAEPIKVKAVVKASESGIMVLSFSVLPPVASRSFCKLLTNPSLLTV